MREPQRSLRALGLWEKRARRAREQGVSEFSVYRHHMADQGTEALEREKAAILATREGRYRYGMEEVLHRLRSAPETFGVCKATRKPIALERLDALPHVRYCTGHERVLKARAA